MQTHLDNSFKKVKSSVYSNHKNGFYVYAKPNKCAPDKVIKYIGRYLGRPVIATSRIDEYDGENVGKSTAKINQPRMLKSEYFFCLT
ncbi:MAG: transposase [Hespellia sp.]|nr:transposase [Hespellia sp.]